MMRKYGITVTGKEGKIAGYITYNINTLVTIQYIV